MTKKYQKTDKSLTFACLSFLGTVTFGILTLCFCAKDVSANGFPLWAIFAICCGAFLLAYAVLLVYAFAKEKDGKRILELSVEIPIIAVVVFALSPIAAILWLVECLVDAIAAKKSQK